jgi:hypothetical protein
MSSPKRQIQPDTWAVIALILLWLLFFWRLFTPVDVDQTSIIEGDFSGQFFTFGAYQYERLTAGEIPLWNPYNNGGLPFIADTQAAVFYPPRLITIAISSITGGWHYNSLQMEMVAHVLLYTLFMYILVRRMTLGKGLASIIGAFIAAIVAGYGGFMAGYPPLQLALLEAGIWLPLALLGILEATRHPQLKWMWLVMGGFMLGISWMAGHSQTSWFATYLIVAYMGYRTHVQKFNWLVFVGGTAIIGFVSIGISAVQLLPSFEYLGHTTRNGMGFNDKLNGFSIQHIIQFIFPSVMSLWSPLYVGVSGLVLAIIALIGRERERLFWGLVALIALGLSFGGNSAVFHSFYNILPGLRYFRGQERAAYLVANSLAILAGLGIVTLNAHRNDERLIHMVKKGLAGLAIAVGSVTGIVFIAKIGFPDEYTDMLNPIVLSTIIAGILLLLIPRLFKQDQPLWLVLLAILVVFELFTVNIDNSNYESIRADEHFVMTVPPLVERIKEDTEIPFRVDGGMIGGHFGIYGHGNTGSLYQLQDIRGISPLFLEGPYAIIQQELPTELDWELFAVKYVFTDWEVLLTESELIARDYPDGNTLNLHRLSDPRPFALLMTDYEVIETDQEARWKMAEPEFDARMTVILDRPPDLDLPNMLPGDAETIVTNFAPEQFAIQTSSSTNALLSVSHVDYPGWRVEIDGEKVETIRAYGALVAVPISAGEHTISFTYDSPSYKLGAMLSLVTWVGMGILGGILMLKRTKIL